MAKSISKSRWDKLRQRMIVYGIQDLPLTAIPANVDEIIKGPEEAAGRLVMLLSIAFSASNSGETDKISDWLKREEVWQVASENEKSFFREQNSTDEEKAKLSFRFEGAYMLAWVLGHVQTYPDPASESDAESVSDFFANIPPLFGETDVLVEEPGYRKIQEIHNEYLFYKMAHQYFKYIKKVDKENTSNLHMAAAYERFLVLEWLFNAADADWDQVILQLEEEEE